MSACQRPMPRIPTLAASAQRSRKSNRLHSRPSCTSTGPETVQYKPSSSISILTPSRSADCIQGAAPELTEIACSGCVPRSCGAPADLFVCKRNDRSARRGSTGTSDAGVRGLMRAALTQAPGTIELVDVPEPADPESGEVVVRPLAVGICGSDYHFLSGHLTEAAGGGAEAFPKVQGHEIGATIEAVGPDCRPGLDPG